MQKYVEAFSDYASVTEVSDFAEKCMFVLILLLLPNCLDLNSLKVRSEFVFLAFSNLYASVFFFGVEKLPSLSHLFVHHR